MLSAFDISGGMVLDGIPIIIRSEAMQRLFALVKRVAKHNSAVLVTGETGAGKEIVARAIHLFSPRAEGPLIDLNCAALPEHLMESELFGYEKGAFSGAESLKRGLFELADKGTLFLDEIGDLDPRLQVKLLRVLDGAGFFRLGGTRKVSVDVRVIAATNQDPEQAVESGKLRMDLFHRLAQFRLNVPPLRERPDDIAALAEHVLHHHFPHSRLSPEALARLQSYPWPGNVRELKNIVLRAIMLAKNAQVEITARELPPEIGGRGSLPLPPSQPQASLSATSLEELEKQAIIEALARTGGHHSQAAEQLGISRRTLARKLKAYRLDGEQPVGVLGHEQQRYYRAQVSVPVALQFEDGSAANATLLNVSVGGLAVHLKGMPMVGNRMRVSFQLPACPWDVCAQAELAWTDPEGKAGLRFTAIDRETEEKLQAWLVNTMKGEGWQLG